MRETLGSDGVSDRARVPEFAPADPTDGRELGDWRSRYDDPFARRVFWFEAAYLAALLITVPILVLVLWLGRPKAWLRVSDQTYKPVLKYGVAWLSGVLGGTLFDVKWLYHSVARQTWHLDRRLWRLFTPHLSGGLAFVVVALISSGMLRVFDRQALESMSMVLGIGFMVGYFSDSAVAKLSEIAETLFGASSAKEKHKEDKLGRSSERGKD
jgi:hypothetical protein